jgi:hypothetical protein
MKPEILIGRAQLGSSHPPLIKRQLATALPAERRVSARRGWAGEKSGLSEQPAGFSERVWGV